MKEITKKITSIFFILLGFTPMLFALFIALKKEQIYQQMKQEFKQQSLQTIVLHENEIVWMNKNEIWVDNSMFDIENKKLDNGIYTFTGLYDEDETTLKKMGRNATEKNKDQNMLLANLFKHIPVFCNQSIELATNKVQQGLYNHFAPSNSENPFREIFIPPPQGLLLA